MPTLRRALYVAHVPPSTDSQRPKSRIKKGRFQPFLMRFRTASQRFLKAGARFSTKAVMPSFLSSVANIEWNRRRSKRTPSLKVVS